MSTDNTAATTANTTATATAPADTTVITTCDLQVDTQSPGWQKTLTKVLKSIKGLSYTIDASRGLARVSGQIDPCNLLLLLAKTGKHAELLWIDSGNKHGNAQDNIYGKTPSMIPGNGYGYFSDHLYNPYEWMDYYLNDPYQRYLYPPQYQEYYYPPQQYRDYYPPQYYKPYPYYEPQALYFPQEPPPVPNPRLESLCNMM